MSTLVFGSFFENTAYLFKTGIFSLIGIIGVLISCLALTREGSQ